MIVVSNTSPLTNLAAVGQFALLHRLYSELHIAYGVWDELNAGGKRWPGRDEVATADIELLDGLPSTGRGAQKYLPRKDREGVQIPRPQAEQV
jgi:hypothetical protein